MNRNIETAIKNRYEFVVYFDVENGNPNGDPNADNMPRIDPDTNHGLVTDVCLKRKIRDYVDIVKEGEDGFDLYIKSGDSLNEKDISIAAKRGIDVSKLNQDKYKVPGDKERDEKIVADICATYYDIRTFGAVMTTFTKNGMNFGQLRGPVQLGFARSVDPIFSQEVAITRVVGTTDERNENINEMGRKYIVPYALYRVEGYISANLARKTTGFSEDDLELFFQAVENMFEHDHSATRGKMVVRSLIIFKHDSELGNAPSWKLFEAVTCKKSEGVDSPRSFKDYDGVQIDRNSIPSGVEVIERV